MSERGVFATLLYTKEELEVLQTAVGALIATNEASVSIAQSALVRKTLSARWGILNALRTSLAEARYGLMTPEQLEEEREARKDAERLTGEARELGRP